MVPTVSNKKATNEKSWFRIRNPVYGSKDPDPYQNVPDPEHRLKSFEGFADAL